MIMNFPGIGGDNPQNNGGNKGGGPPGNREGGDKKPMNNGRGDNKGKKEVVLSKQTIKESEHSLAFAWMGLGVSELFRRPIRMSASVIGMFVLAGIAGGLLLGIGAAVFRVALPENVRKSTEVGYIIADTTITIGAEAGRALVPATGRIGRVVIDAGDRAGFALVATALDNEAAYLEQLDRTPRRPEGNPLLVNYRETNRGTQRRRTPNTTRNRNLVRLEQ
jgi:hypothetical protein